MFPPILEENPVKSSWSHADCFGNEPLDYVRAFVHENYTIGMHSHDFYEINFVLKGTGRHYIENQFCDIQRGCVFVIPPNIQHGYIQQEPLDVYHILLSCTFMQHYAFELKNLPGYSILFEIEPYLRGTYQGSLFLKLNESEMNELENKLNTLLAVCNEDYNGSGVMKNALSLIIIALLCKHISERNKNSRLYVKKNHQQAIVMCLEFIHTQYSKKISIDTLSKICHLSRSTLLRNFKMMCKCSPIHYLNNYRIKKAKELMLTTDWDLSNVAISCGFYDQSHFTKTFRQIENMTPSQFKKANMR